MLSSKAYPLMVSMKGLPKPKKDLSPYLIHCTTSWNPFTAFLFSLTFAIPGNQKLSYMQLPRLPKQGTLT